MTAIRDKHKLKEFEGNVQSRLLCKGILYHCMAQKSANCEMRNNNWTTNGDDDTIECIRWDYNTLHYIIETVTTVI